MSTYTFSQLQQLWVSAGGNPQASSVAAAVAMAESGGNPNATGPVGERGLWQIALSHGSLSTYDPTANARAAIQISNNGSNWRPWCTAYTDGACGTNGGNYSPTAGSPSGRILTGAGGGSVPSTNGSAGGNGQNVGVLGSIFGGSIFDPTVWLHMTDVVLNNLFYAAVALLGGFMMAVGAYILLRESPVAASTASTLTAARKVARIA